MCCLNEPGRAHQRSFFFAAEGTRASLLASHKDPTVGLRPEPYGGFSAGGAAPYESGTNVLFNPVWNGRAPGVRRGGAGGRERGGWVHLGGCEGE